MKKSKSLKLLAFLISFTMLFTTMPAIPAYATGDGDAAPVQENTIIESGTCGPNANWTFDDQGELVITGSGAITTNDGFLGYQNTVKSVVIGEGITEIGNYIFDHFNNGENIQLPSTLTVIGKNAFCNFGKFTGVLELPEGLTSIGENAFAEVPCTGTLVIPKSIKCIGPSTFDRTDISSVHIPEGVETIKWSAFEGCENLDGDIVLPESLEFIGMSAFFGCSKIDNIVLLNENTEIDSLFVEDEVAHVGYEGSTIQTFAENNGLTFKTYCEYYGHNSAGEWEVTKEPTCVETGLKVKACSNKNCSGEKETILVTDEHDFYDWGISEPAVIGRAGSEIRMCRNCYTEETREYYIVESGTCGENATFELDWEGTLTVKGTGAIDDYTYYDQYKSHIKSIVIEEGITEVGQSVFTGCSSCTSLALPSTLRVIGDWAFSENNQYELDLPDGLTAIGYAAFANTHIVGKLVIPGSVETISAEAFGGQIGVTSVEFSEGIKRIEEKAFFFENYSEVLVLPESLEYVGRNALMNNGVLEIAMLSDDVKFHEDFASSECTDVKLIGYEGSTTDTFAKTYGVPFKTYCEHFGHEYSGDWVTVKEPTEKEKGLQERACGNKNCTVPETKELDIIGHEHNYITVVLEPTCETDGYTTYTCDGCGDSYTSDHTDMLGHDYGEWIVQQESTMTQPGEKYRVCSNCGGTETAEIEATGHTLTFHMVEPETGKILPDYGWLTEHSFKAATGSTAHDCWSENGMLDPVVKGYQLSWYTGTESDGYIEYGDFVELEDVVINGDTDLYAHWRKITENISISNVVIDNRVENLDLTLGDEAGNAIASTVNYIIINAETGADGMVSSEFAETLSELKASETEAGFKTYITITDGVADPELSESAVAIGAFNIDFRCEIIAEADVVAQSQVKYFNMPQEFIVTLDEEYNDVPEEATREFFIKKRSASGEDVGTEVVLVSDSQIRFAVLEAGAVTVAYGDWNPGNEGGEGDEGEDVNTSPFAFFGDSAESVAGRTLQTILDAVNAGSGSVDNPLYEEIVTLSQEDIDGMSLGMPFSTMLEESEVPQVERDAMQQTIGDISEVGQYYYISYGIKIGEMDTDHNLEVMDEAIEVNLHIPENLKKDECIFGVVNLRNGQAEAMDVEIIDGGSIAQFTTDTLGRFALVYIDPEEIIDPEPEDPNDTAIKDAINEIVEDFINEGDSYIATEKAENSIKDAVKAGADLAAQLEKTEISEAEARETDEYNLIDSIINELGDSGDIVAFYDLSVVLSRTDTDTEIGYIDELEEPLKIELEVPDDIPPVAEGYDRSYYVYSLHESSKERTPAMLSKDGSKVTFKADQFSTYILAYDDFIVGTAGVEINEENFPDPVFREYVQELDNDYGKGNGYFNAEDDYYSNSINLEGKGIKDLTGIEYFVGLDYLYVGNNELTELDLSSINLTTLTDVAAAGNKLENVKLNRSADYDNLDFRYNNMTDESAIDVNGNESVEDMSLYYFYPQGECTPVALNAENFPDPIFREVVMRPFDENEDGYFDPAIECNTNFFEIGNYEITDLKGIEHFTRLNSLDCHSNNLTELDLSQLHYIWELDVSDNDLNSIKVSDKASFSSSWGTDFRYNNLGEMEELLSQNKNIDPAEIDFYPQGEKTDVEISEANFPDAALRAVLKREWYDKNEDGVLSWKELEEISSISDTTQINDYTGIHLLTSLNYLDIGDHGLTEIPELPKGLSQLSIFNNEISSIEGVPKTIQSLDINGNAFEGTLDLSEFKYLRNVYCYDNKISKIILNSDVKYRYLKVHKNNMNSTADVVGNSSIVWDGVDFKFHDQNPLCMRGEDHKYTSRVIKKAGVGISGTIRYTCSYGCGDTYDKDIIALIKPTISPSSYIYNGTVRVPEIKVQDVFDKVLKEGTDYTLTYSSGRKSVGRYSITVNLQGNYTGKYTCYFNILPAAPSSAKAVLYGYDDVQFSWSKSTGASGYYVYYKKSTSSSYSYLGSTTGLSYKKADLSDGVKYNFKVVPYFKTGSTTYKSSKYKTASVYTLKKMSTPTVAKYSSKSVKISWTKISGVTGYQIYRSTRSTSGYSKLKTVSSGYKSTTATATKNKTLYYKIRPYVKVGTKYIYGPWSKERGYKLK